MRKIVAITFNHNGELEDERVLCRIPAGTVILAADLLTAQPMIVVAVDEDQDVECCGPLAKQTTITVH